MQQRFLDRNGGFGEWSAFGNCSEECGPDGIRERTRACDSPTQEGTGADCVGDTLESESCNVQLVSFNSSKIYKNVLPLTYRNVPNCS